MTEKETAYKIFLSYMNKMHEPFRVMDSEGNRLYIDKFGEEIFRLDLEYNTCYYSGPVFFTKLPSFAPQVIKPFIINKDKFNEGIDYENFKNEFILKYFIKISGGIVPNSIY